MADRVRMTSKSTFQNERIKVLATKDGPRDGEGGSAVTPGDSFETDALHGRELARLGLAAPDGWSLDDTDEPALEPHHQVSVGQLEASRTKRGKRGPNPAETISPLPLTEGAAPLITGAPVDGTASAAVQANRADGGAPVPVADAVTTASMGGAPKPGAGQ